MSLVPGTGTQADLLRQVGDGVLVQSVTGLHSGVNPISGDFSTGAEGLRIRGGELAEPVREFTIASTLQRMLHDVVAIGADLEWLPMSAAGVTLVIARRDGQRSVTDDLLELAGGVVDRAEPGEQVEVYVAGAPALR